MRERRGDGEVLAGEAAADEVNPPRLFDPGRMCERSVPEISDIAEPRDVGVAPFEDPSAEPVDLNLCDALPSRPFESEADPLDAGEERDEGRLIHARSF